MKRDITPHIKKAAAEVALTSVEREHMAFVLREYMSLKPLKPVAEVSAEGFFIWKWSLFARTLVRRQIPAFLVLVLLFTGGVTYAAEGAVPGDSLYPLKVEVNERVRTVLTLSTEGRATWEARRAERRLEEASVLAAEGRLDEEISKTIEATFEVQAKKAADAIEKLQGKNSPAAIELASHIETALSAQSAILAQLLLDEEGGEGEHVARPDRHFSGTVKNSVARIAQIRVKAEGELAISGAGVAESVVATSSAKVETSARANTDGQKGAAERMRSAATAKIDTAATLFARSAGSLEDGEEARMAGALQDARELLEKGNNSFNQGFYSASFRLFQEAYITADALSLYLKAGTAYQVRLPTTNVSIERGGGITPLVKGSSTEEEEQERKGREGGRITVPRVPSPGDVLNTDLLHVR